jgi:hypothetical protein
MEVNDQLHAAAALPQERSPSYAFDRAGLGGEEKNNHFPCRELNLRRPTHNLVTILTETRVQ